MPVATVCPVGSYCPSGQALPIPCRNHTYVSMQEPLSGLLQEFLLFQGPELKSLEIRPKLKEILEKFLNVVKFNHTYVSIQ